MGCNETLVRFRGPTWQLNVYPGNWYPNHREIATLSRGLQVAQRPVLHNYAFDSTTEICPTRLFLWRENNESPYFRRLLPGSTSGNQRAHSHTSQTTAPLGRLRARDGAPRSPRNAPHAHTRLRKSVIEHQNPGWRGGRARLAAARPHLYSTAAETTS